ncbi:MAG: acetyl-CoA carboxylase biotin carboxyl carrier protein subunit, partial [Pseudomonadota bacterium]
GDTLALLEAMKMEHALPSPRDGTVETISASEGDQVSEGDVLIALVPEEG